jgi:hypothetical protein
MRHLKISYSDIMRMPTFERRFYIQTYKEEMEEKKEKMEEQAKNSSSGGKGSRSRTVSGEALKSQIKNNKIPQQ